MAIYVGHAHRIQTPRAIIIDTGDAKQELTKPSTLNKGRSRNKGASNSLAQLGEHRLAEPQEFAGSNSGPTNTQGL